jgi:hypothetical protein
MNTQREWVMDVRVWCDWDGHLNTAAAYAWFHRFNDPRNNPFGRAIFRTLKSKTPQELCPEAS